MPLDQVICSFAPNNIWLNVVLVKSLDLLKPDTITRGQKNKKAKENIMVYPNGISWTEKNTEHCIALGDYFEIFTEPLYTQFRKFDDCIYFNLKLRQINSHLLMRQTVKVGITDLRINLVANKPFSLHCSNCATELIPRRAYRIIDPLPTSGKRVLRHFWNNLVRTNISYSDRIYYGLNRIVMSASHIEFDTKMIYCRRRSRVLCPGCRKVLGTFIPGAVCLHADVLRMATRVSPAARLEFNDLFGHITPTQLLLRLMKDTKTSRIFLKTERPDGQLHYLLLCMETPGILFLRSKPTLFSKIVAGPVDGGDTSSESEDSIEINSSSSSCSESENENEIENSSSYPNNTPKKSIDRVFLTAYNGYRAKYIFASTDSELCDIQDIVDEWRYNNVRSQRISYSMMIELVSELNANEHIATALENVSPPARSLDPRFSHFILESDEEFYATQQQLDDVQVP